MIIFWKFQPNPSIFEQDIKYKEKDHLIMRLGASLTRNNLWTKFFSQMIFPSWKTLLSSKFWQKMRKILRAVFEKIPKNLMFHHLLLILRKLRFFWKILFKLFLVPYCLLDLCKKSEKSLEQILRKKMLLTNGLTDNTEFIRPFPSGVQFKMIYANYFVSYTFLWNLTAIFNFHRCIMNNGRLLLVEKLQAIVYRIFSDRQI